MEQKEINVLIQKAKQNDRQAQEQLVTEVQSNVYYLCKKMLKNEDDAMDATQDVLISMLTKLDQLQEPGAFKGWVNTITVNRCKRMLSKGGREIPIDEDEEGNTLLDFMEDLDEQTVPDKAVDNEETRRMIAQLVDDLPEAQRMTVLLYYYEEMSVRDIAAVMETSEGTVKSRLNYARKAIKEGVVGYEKEGVKLYGLSPLPLLLYFLQKDAAVTGLPKEAVLQLTASAVGTSAGEAAGGVAAGEAAAASAGTATTTGAAATGAATTGISATGAVAAAAAVKAGGTALGVKIAAAIAAVAIVGGGVAVVSNREVAPAPAVTASLPVPETPTPEPTPELDLAELIRTSGIAYYGDPALCQMTPEQAAAFIDAIEEEMDRLESIEITWTNEEVTYLGYAALFDTGNGIPAMLFVGGNEASYYDESPEEDHWFIGYPWKSTIWNYVNGTAFAEDPIMDPSPLGYSETEYHLDNDGSVYIRDDNALQIVYSNPSAYFAGIFPFVDGRLSSVPIETYASYEPGYGGKGSGCMINGQEVSAEEYDAWAEERPSSTMVAGVAKEQGGIEAICWGLSPMDDVLDLLCRIAGVEKSSLSSKNGSSEFVIDRDGVLTAYNGSDSHVIIPENVTVIGEEVFKLNDTLTTVSLPSGLKEISQGAFQACGLQEIAFPEGLISIGSAAFNATRLTSVTLPESLETIGHSAFLYCPLTSVYIPSKLDLDGSVFAGNRNLKEIKVSPDNPFLYVEDNILYRKDRSELVCYPAEKQGSYIVKEGITSIGECAFRACDNLTAIMLPESVTQIGYSAFRGCTQIKSIVIPDNVTAIASAAFQKCTALENVVLSKGLTAINSYVFAECESLKTISLPDGVTDIRSNAFQKCTNLEVITIPESVTYIDPDLPAECPNLMIRGIRGSFAESYANENNIPFVAVGQ